MQSRSGNPEVLTSCGSQSHLYCVGGFRYRITISFNPPPCLQGFELPLNGQILSAIGIWQFVTLLIPLSENPAMGNVNVRFEFGHDGCI